MFGEVADIKTADTLDLPRPKANYRIVVAPPSDLQREMVEGLAVRAAAVQKRLVKPEEDNMLKITSDGRKIGLDQRLMNPLNPDDPASKVNMCMENVYRIWDETSDKRLTQAIFCDFSTPDKNIWVLSREQRAEIADLPAEQKQAVLDKHIMDTARNYAAGIYPADFNVYDDIKAKLILKGVPADEIQFIHHANTDHQKKVLFSKVRSGKVRVILGSTAKCGAGTNIQKKLIALHDLDCPWRPADLAQRAGRIERQGNDNPEVDIYRYVTEGTFDAYLFQTIQKKQEFISQIMTSKSPVRTCDDMDEQALSFAEIKALATGNPLIIEKSQLEAEVGKLKILKANHQSTQYRLEDNLRLTFPKQIEGAKTAIAGYTADIARLEANTVKVAEGISPLRIGEHTYTERKDAGQALIDACKEIKGMKAHNIGSYRGFEISITYDAVKSEYNCHLKGAMTHSVSLGNDPGGNITRIDNALEKITQTLKSTEERLETLLTQVKNAEAEINQPFPHETLLAEKSAKLAEINKQLSEAGKEEQNTQTADTPAVNETVTGENEPGKILAVKDGNALLSGDETTPPITRTEPVQVAPKDAHPQIVVASIPPAVAQAKEGYAAVLEKAGEKKAAVNADQPPIETDKKKKHDER
jgi:hypothetical protein